MLRLFMILALSTALLFGATTAVSYAQTETVTPTIAPSSNCYTLISTYLYGAQRVQWPSPPFAISSAGLDTMYQQGYNDWYITALSGSFDVVYGNTGISGNPYITFDSTGTIGVIGGFLPSAYEVWTASTSSDPFSLQICSAALPTSTPTPFYLQSVDISVCDVYHSMRLVAGQSATVVLSSGVYYRFWSLYGAISSSDWVVSSPPLIPNVVMGLGGDNAAFTFRASSDDTLYVCRILDSTATPTATATPSATDTPTITATPSATPTITATPSATPTITATPSATDTPIATVTPSVTPTITATPSLTPTTIPSPTSTPYLVGATLTPYIPSGVTLNPSGLLDPLLNKEPFHSVHTVGIVMQTVTADWSAQSPVVMPQTCHEVVAIPGEPSGSPASSGTDVLQLDLGAKTATGICNVINVMTKFRYFTWYASTLIFAVIFGRYLFTLPRRLSGTVKR